MGKLKEMEIGKIRLLLTDKTLTDIQKYYLKTYLASLLKIDKPTGEKQVK